MRSEIIEIVLNAVRPLRVLLLAASFAAIGCHAQTATPGAAGPKLSPELARRVEVMIRSRADLPPQYVINVGDRTKSFVPGFDEISITFSADGKTSKPMMFMLSDDGKTLAQFNRFDISEDPRLKVPAGDRPARGGSADAPVTIVGFDDLECPYCAKLHAQLFPAILERYKSQVRVIYLDFPLDIHPWAARAAIDANCLAAGSTVGYWNYVDYVHAHAADLGGAEHSLDKAKADLDKLAQDEGSREKMAAEGLNACIQKQDDSKVKALIQQGYALGVESTPVLFINGEKLEGAVPIEYIYRMIDGALTAAGQTPPPPYVPEPPAPVIVPPKPGS